MRVLALWDVVLRTVFTLAIEVSCTYRLCFDEVKLALICQDRCLCLRCCASLSVLTDHKYALYVNSFDCSLPAATPMVTTEK